MKKNLGDFPFNLFFMLWAVESFLVTIITFSYFFYLGENYIERTTEIISIFILLSFLVSILITSLIFIWQKNNTERIIKSNFFAPLKKEKSYSTSQGPITLELLSEVPKKVPEIPVKIIPKNIKENLFWSKNKETVKKEEIKEPLSTVGKEC